MLSSGDSAMHGYLHTNKYSVLASHSLFQDEPVASQADLVIFDPEHLPNTDYLTDIDINTCAVSWYGLTGRYSSFKGSNAAVHALSGLMRGIGAVEGPPVIPPGYQAQMIGGLSADETQQLEQQGVIGTKPRMPSGKSATSPYP